MGGSIMGNAGRVLMIPKGEYNSATTYEMLDFVYYQGRSYVCKQTSTGNVPTNTTYWQALTGDASAEIQALTNKLEDEAETRAALGAHNILPNIATSKTGITINDDKSITINGTFSSTSYCNLDYLTSENHSFNVSEYKGISLIASISETEITGVHVFFGYFKTDNTSVNGTDVTTKSNIVYPSDAAYGRTFLEVRAGTYDNVTIYPMLRLASDTDPTYQPYAKTNVELTQDVETIVSQIEVASGITLQDNKVIKCGDVVHVYFEITSPPDTTGGNVVIGTIPFLPRTNFSFINAYSRSNPFDIKHTVFIRGNNGEVVFPTGVTSSGVFVEGTFICK